MSPRLRSGHDVVWALQGRRDQPQTVEALPALALVDSLSQRPVLQKVRLLDVNRCAAARALLLGGGPALDSTRPRCSNLVGQPYFHHVPRFAAFDQPQSAMVDEPAHGLPRRPAGKMDRASEPKNGKAEAELPFQPTMS